MFPVRSVKVLISMGAAFVLVGCSPAPQAKIASAPTDIQSVPDLNAPSPSPLPIGKPAPDFRVASLDGKDISLSSLRGQVVLIDFWATWCPPCVEGLPEIARLSHLETHGTLAVIPIGCDQEGPMRNFLRKQTYKLASYLDPDRAAQKAYLVDPIPCTVLIDANGNLAQYFVGLQSPQALTSALKTLGVKL